MIGNKLLHAGSTTRTVPVHAGSQKRLCRPDHQAELRIIRTYFTTCNGTLFKTVILDALGPMAVFFWNLHLYSVAYDIGTYVVMSLRMYAQAFMVLNKSELANYGGLRWSCGPN